MIAGWRLAWSDLASRWQIAAATALLIATPLMGFLLLDGFARGIQVDFVDQIGSELVVQEANSLGEIAGSRIPIELQRIVEERSPGYVVPEIHTVTGTSAENAVMIRGVEPTLYRQISAFDTLEGAPLDEASGLREAMIGIDLAQRLNLRVGDQILLRGRPFTVSSLFETGTYADNEAWLTIPAAQDLLNWGTDVSIFVIPDDGAFTAGESLGGSIAVGRKGEFGEVAAEWEPILDLTRLAALAMATAGAAILAAVLWRMAWLRRRDLAMLRVMGLGQSVPAVYAATIGVVVTACGAVIGFLGAIAVARLLQLRAVGFFARAVIDGIVMLRGGVAAVSILGLSLLGVMFRLQGTSPAQLLRRD